jgi:hypothetical protein
MVKIRIRDKFVFIKDAPWKVFDQFEIFFNSMSVNLTRKFYTKIQMFMLFSQEKKKIDELQSMKDERKIDMLMPARNTVVERSIDDDDSEFSSNSKKKNPLNTLPQYVSTVGQRSDAYKESSGTYREDNSHSSESEESKGEYLESMTAAFRKTQNIKGHNTVVEQRSATFGLNNFKKMISNKVKTIRNYASKSKDEKVVRHPVYFRYFRINEIGVSLTYKHGENSMLNTKNLRIIIKPFIKHGKFITFQKMLSKYEKFCKRSLIYQIPSILKQKLLKITLSKDDDDYEDELEDELKSVKSRTILFGNYAKI